MSKLRGFLDFDRLHFGNRAAPFWLPLLKLALPELNHLTLDGILSCLVHRAIANMEDFGCAQGGHVIGGNDHVKLFDAVELACGYGNLTRGLIKRVSSAVPGILSIQVTTIVFAHMAFVCGFKHSAAAIRELCTGGAPSAAHL